MPFRKHSNREFEKLKKENAAKMFALSQGISALLKLIIG